MSHLNNGLHSKLEGRFELHIRRALIMILTGSLSKILLQSSAPGQQLIWGSTHPVGHIQCFTAPTDRHTLRLEGTDVLHTEIFNSAKR